MVAVVVQLANVVWCGVVWTITITHHKDSTGLCTASISQLNLSKRKFYHQQPDYYLNITVASTVTTLNVSPVYLFMHEKPLL